MADKAPTADALHGLPPPPPAPTTAPDAPANEPGSGSVTGSDDTIKQESSEPTPATAAPAPVDDDIAMSLADSILNALKRPRSPEPTELVGDEKRQKTEEHAFIPKASTPDVQHVPAPEIQPTPAPQTQPADPSPPNIQPPQAGTPQISTAQASALQASTPQIPPPTQAPTPQAPPPPQISTTQTQPQQVPSPQVQPPVVPPPEEPTPSWDVAALLESALETFDENVFADLLPPEPAQPTSRPPDVGVLSTAPPLVTPMAAPVASMIKQDQKKMKFYQSSTYIVRSMGLPFLGALAVQVLLALSERSRGETVPAIRSSESEIGKAYKALSATFQQARKMFSETSSILYPDELEIKESGDLETIQMANMATICSTIFESDRACLVEAHDGFLRTFLPEYGPLTDDLTQLFLSLKTQAFLRACPESTEEPRMRELLAKFFPADAEAPLKQLHPDLPLTQTEKVFVSASTKRGERLANEVRDTMKRKLLAIEYPWEGFMDDMNKYLRGNIDNVFRYAESQGIEIPTDEEPMSDMQVDGAMGLDLSALQAAVGAGANGIYDVGSSGLSDGLGLGKLIQASLDKEKAPESVADSKGLASLIAEKLGANMANSPYHTQAGLLNNGAMQNHYLSHTQYQNTQYASAYQQGATPGHNLDLPPHQSSPSTVLYERARQAAVAKSTVNSRREGLHSTRRPWTPEEERALMTGLDMVKGPHWSQILGLFGSSGTINDILKDRTQVQLKDKARNLKLFFLKTNSEMPYYLQCVTGELKTRAPSQAARKEAEEKAKLNPGEEPVRAQAVANISAGLHNNKPASPSPSAPTYSPLTPAGSVYGGRTASPSTPVQTPAPGPAKVPIPPATSSMPTQSSVAHAPLLPNGSVPRPVTAAPSIAAAPHHQTARAGPPLYSPMNHQQIHTQQQQPQMMYHQPAARPLQQQGQNQGQTPSQQQQLPPHQRPLGQMAPAQARPGIAQAQQTRPQAPIAPMAPRQPGQQVAAQAMQQQQQQQQQASLVPNRGVPQQQAPQAAASGRMAGAQPQAAGAVSQQQPMLTMPQQPRPQAAPNPQARPAQAQVPYQVRPQAQHQAPVQEQPQVQYQARPPGQPMAQGQTQTQPQAQVQGQPQVSYQARPQAPAHPLPQAQVQPQVSLNQPQRTTAHSPAAQGVQTPGQQTATQQAVPVAQPAQAPGQPVTTQGTAPPAVQPATVNPGGQATGQSTAQPQTGANTQQQQVAPQAAAGSQQASGTADGVGLGQNDDGGADAVLIRTLQAAISGVSG